MLPVGPDADLGHDDDSSSVPSPSGGSTATSTGVGAAAAVGGAAGAAAAAAAAMVADPAMVGDACDALASAATTVEFMEIFESTGKVRKCQNLCDAILC